MAPELWVALASIALTAVNLLYNGWRDSKRLAFEERLQLAQFTESRSVKDREVAYDKLRAIEIAIREADHWLWWYSPDPVDRASALDVPGETERILASLRAAHADAAWFQYMGWTENLRTTADALIHALEIAEFALDETRYKAIQVGQRDSIGDMSAFASFLADSKSNFWALMEGVRKALNDLGGAIRDS
jgi:hypothetical protein